MKILRFPRPKTSESGPSHVHAPAPDSRGRPIERAGTAGRDEARTLWAMAALQRPLVETLLAKRAPARGILLDFRRPGGFGETGASLSAPRPGNDCAPPVEG